MSSKQLARTVIVGQLVTFEVVGRQVSGYLCGMDDFHWMIVTPDRVKHLVHKSSAIVTLSDEKTFDDEIHKDDLEKIVGPFRSRMRRDFFGHADASGDKDS